MAWWSKKDREPADRIASATLAEYGRFAFLGPDAYAGPLEAGTSGWDAVSPLVLAMTTPAGRADVLAELRRHAADGQWQRVGAWKVVKEYDGVNYGTDALDIVRSGFQALSDMRVTNVGHHIAYGEVEWWVKFFGSPPPNNFAGPPVFDSNFGPSRQNYLDQVAAASTRPVARLPELRGAEPGDLREAAFSVWNLGLLIYRGANRISVEIRSEPSAVHAAAAAASNADHALVVDRLATEILNGDALFRDSPWPALGAARFTEDYLRPRATGTDGYARLRDFGLNGLLMRGLLETDVPIGALTDAQRCRVAQLTHADGGTHAAN